MLSIRKQLGEILMAHRIITKEQLDEALVEQTANPKPLGRILVNKGFITDKLLLQALASQKGISAWHLDQDPPQSAALSKVSQDVCREYCILPVRIQGDLLMLAMKNPDDIETIELVRNITKLRIEPVLAEEGRLIRQIESAFFVNDADLTSNKSVNTYVKQALETYGGEGISFSNFEKADLASIDTRPVVGLVNQIVLEALAQKASDIHIEPMSEKIDVRYRIDGELVPAMSIPSALGPMLSTRIKIMAGVDIVETRVPQDGRISADFANREIDFRVSVLPSYHGPRIVMRILDQGVGLRNMCELGFSQSNLQLFRQLIERPYGLFLVTGPTGSGKTTTLYTALNDLKTGHNNIMTCEDPVEYLIDGINQSQVNDKVGLTFAMQLRAILRQDPDIVLVGEIRDQETAETAIRASMTGHLVLSTLHTNDAPSSIPRLLDMGIDPFLLSTSLVGVMSQRLLRVLCPKCKVEVAPSGEEVEILHTAFGSSNTEKVFRPIGCDSCFGTGYKGRMAIHELMPVTAEVSRMIADHVPVEVIRETAAFYGYRTIQEDALRRIREGLTSVQEAKRLIAFDTIERQDDLGRSRLMAA